MKKMKTLTVKDITTPLNGFFSHLVSEDLISQYFTYQDLDLYFFNKYADKCLSPLTTYYIDPETLELSDENKALLIQAAYNKFKTQWKHLLQIYYIIENKDWNPTYNYELHITETRTDTPGVSDTEQTTINNTAGTTRTTSREETQTINETTTTTPEGQERTTDSSNYTTTEDTGTTTNKRNVFNTSDAEPSIPTDSSSYTNRQENDTTRENLKEFIDRVDTESKTGTDRNTGTEALTGTDTQQGTETKTTSHTGEDTYELTREEMGSQGVSSAADQVLKNIEAMEKVDLADIIITNVASLLLSHDFIGGY